jgi:DNA-directed RNA polymerase subunit beta'
VKLNGKETTAGRIMLTTALPEAMHSNVLHNLEQPLDKKGLNAMLTTLGKNHQPEFDKSVNLLKDLGNTASTGVVEMKFHHAHTPAIAREMGVDGHEPLHIAIGGHTLGLEDFTTDKVSREKALQEAKQKIAVIDKMQLSDAEKERRRVEAYIQADVQARKLHEQSGTGKNLYTMHKAGIKPSWDQYKQMVLAPMLVKDSSDKIVSTPITRSYGEGLDVMGYWTQLHGARRGSVMKVQEVQEPGYMSKLLMNSMMDVLVTGTDCGTNKGVSLHIGEKDVHDRTLAQDYKAGAVHVPAGTLLTPQVVSDIRAHDKNAQIMVRSPLKCEHDKGVCQKCAGLSSRGADHPVGSNIGVHAAQTIGERAVQLTMKSFHTGGSVEQGGGKLLNAFSRFQQLTMLPKKIPDSAALANNTGTVSHIEDVGTGVNVTINGHKHFVGKDTTGNPLHLPLPGSKTDWKGLHVGMHVNAGQHLSDPSRTYVNPHDLYKATKSIDAVQNHIVGEIYDLYKDEGIKRRHVETAVRAMSNLTKVTNPGDAHDILHGEFKPLMAVQRMNQELLRDGKKPIVHTPVLKGVNMLPFDAQEDWMAKLQHQKLRTSIADSAAIGAKSNIHGMHPIPAIAYGAEIGLNESHSNTPGLEHLKNVKKSLY